MIRPAEVAPFSGSSVDVRVEPSNGSRGARRAGELVRGSNASRHSNYFFEWCVWIGYAVVGIAYLPWGLIALAPQAIILGSIFGVTGIPPTEHQAIRSKGDAYRAYQKRVSKFVPLPPKSRANEA